MSKTVIYDSFLEVAKGINIVPDWLCVNKSIIPLSKMAAIVTIIFLMYIEFEYIDNFFYIVRGYCQKSLVTARSITETLLCCCRTNTFYILNFWVDDVTITVMHGHAIIEISSQS